MSLIKDLFGAARTGRAERVDEILYPLDRDTIFELRKLTFLLWTRMAHFAAPRLASEALRGVMGIRPLPGASEPLTDDPRGSQGVSG